jgi:hypothetical protein
MGCWLTGSVANDWVWFLYGSRADTKKVKGGERTTHRSKSGKKLYAVRDSKGRFVDIQTYERAHRMDIKRKSKKEK